MKFRHKLYLNILLIAVISVVFALTIIYRESRKQLIYQLKSNVRTIAGTAAMFVDGNDLKDIQTRADERSPLYQSVQKGLLKIRDANRRKNIYVKSVYLLRPALEKQGYLSAIAGANPDPQESIYVGQLFSDQDMQGLLEHLDKVYVPNDYTISPWGYFMSGSAPIFDSQGKYVASIVVDIYAGQVVSHLRQLLKYELYALVIALVLAGLFGYYLINRMTSALTEVCLATRAVSEGNLDYSLEISSKDEFGNLATLINEMVAGLKEREKLRVNFARYVSGHILEKLSTLEMMAKLKGERKRIAVLFSDIRQFILLTERLPPEEIVDRLNEYFDVMLEVIFRHDGTLDKFIGDGIMVEFGAPVDIPNPEKQAIRTAIGMQKALQKLCEKWVKEGKEPVEMGIGIHAGEAVLGNIGSEQHLDYTAIGDTVNTASRLDQETKSMRVPILVSEKIWEVTKDEFEFECLGDAQLSGKTEKMKIYSVKFDS